MNLKIKDIIYIIVGFFLSFFASFYSFGGIYCLLSVPIVILSLNYKSIYLFIAFIGMILGAFFIEPNVLPMILLIGFVAGYIFAHFTKKIDISLSVYLSFVAMVYAAFISVGQYLYFRETSATIVVVAPFLVAFLAHEFCELQLNLKSKEKFSLTKKELMFLTITANIVLGLTFVDGEALYPHFLLFSLLNYVSLKIDKYTGLLGTLTGVLFAFQYNELIFVPFLMISSFVFFEKKYYSGILAYASILLFLSIIKYDFLLSLLVIVVSICIILFPRNLFVHLHKYIIDPQDYELKLYQQSYYKTLSQNKKIQKVMGVLENHLKENPKLKKNSQKLILENLEFLRGKLDEDIDIRIKDNILKELNYKKANVLALRFTSDLLENYSVDLEVRHSQLSQNQILNMLEERLGVKLRLSAHKYNYLLDTESFSFENEEQIKFNVNIKQRSKNAGCCGDNYLTFNIKNKKYILISDGMGHGKQAQENSTKSLFLLRNFIELGMEPTNAIVSCNALMIDKNKETFNTLDLLEYNSYDNTMLLYKNGSGVTYLKKKGEITKIQSENLPLGIIEKVKVNKINIDIDSEYIVLTSDGIKKELSNVILNSKAKNAKMLTHDIFQHEGDLIEDDQTIVAINVIKRS